MVRLIIAATFILCAGVLTTTRADAEFEFCPARLSELHEVGVSANTPSALYSFTVDALSTRTVSADLAVRSSAGWFTVPVSTTALIAHETRYQSSMQDFTRTSYVSPVVYARFPRAVTIQDAWVQSAHAIGDGAFGWEARGNVPCDPLGGAKALRDHPTPNLRTTEKNPIDYTALPSSGSQVARATAAKPLADMSCEHPFVGATTLKVVPPQYPYSFKRPPGISLIAVAIGKDGAVQDAWVWGSSGDVAYDSAALTSAVSTTYSAATAYCRPVGQTFLFRAEFSR
ncbi:MAG: hypothetical protein M3R35_02975 [Candidatus Eremiobacteraeota bacterium]|nr:hypothetical protein [Candidatus Eremiobacteraeota bacterium]